MERSLATPRRAHFASLPVTLLVLQGLPRDDRCYRLSKDYGSHHHRLAPRDGGRSQRSHARCHACKGPLGRFP